MCVLLALPCVASCRCAGPELEGLLHCQPHCSYWGLGGGFPRVPSGNSISIHPLWNPKKRDSRAAAAQSSIRQWGMHHCHPYSLNSLSSLFPFITCSVPPLGCTRSPFWDERCAPSHHGASQHRRRYGAELGPGWPRDLCPHPRSLPLAISLLCAGGGDCTFVTIIHLIDFQLAHAGDGSSHRAGDLVVFHVAENNFQGSG